MRICLRLDKMKNLTKVVEVQEQLDCVNRLKDIDELIQRVQTGKNVTQDIFRRHIPEVIETLEHAAKTLNFLDTADIQQKIVTLYKSYNKLKTYHRHHVQTKWNIRKFYKNSIELVEQFHINQHLALEQLKDNTDNFQSSIKQFGDELMENSETYVNYINHNQDEITKLLKTHSQFLTKLNSLSDGLTKRIPLAKERLLDYAATIAIYNDDYKEVVSDIITEFINIIHSVHDTLEFEKQTRTYTLLKERSKLSSSLFIFESEEEYYDYMLQWSSEHGVQIMNGMVGGVSDFKYPTAYFDPNSGETLRTIVSGDPFYVIDDKTYPYIKLLEQLHDASHKKLLLYSKKKAQVEMLPGSIGIGISWNNFPFSTHGQISKDLSLMSSLLRPGGYALFNYADAHTVAGARFIEENKMPVIWRDRMERIAADNGLELVSRYDDKQKKYPFSICLFQKVGKIEDVNLVNKIGLVVPDVNFLKKKE